MYSFEAPDINAAFAHGIQYLLDNGEEESSRVGPVLVAPGPVCTVYTNPTRHVLFSPTRDANPFFNFFEALWMLAGRNDVVTVAAFNSGMSNYSDDKKTLHGAYGNRWRHHFGYDQLDAIVEELTRDPQSRRAVLAIWDGGQAEGYAVDVLGERGGDLAAARVSQDIPCNTHVYFDLRGGAVNMTVCCRSNDAIWGCYGSDVVCFSVLLMYMAARLHRPVGVYRQMSNNFHLYTEKFSRARLGQMVTESIAASHTELSARYAWPWNTRNVPDDWDGKLKRDLTHLFGCIEHWAQYDKTIAPYPYETFWCADIANPTLRAWALHKSGKTEEAIAVTGDIGTLDWELACRQWLERRVK